MGIAELISSARTMPASPSESVRRGTSCILTTESRREKVTW